MKLKKGCSDLKIKHNSSFQKVHVLKKVEAPKKYLTQNVVLSDFLSTN